MPDDPLRQNIASATKQQTIIFGIITKLLMKTQ